MYICTNAYLYTYVRIYVYEVQTMRIVSELEYFYEKTREACKLLCDKRADVNVLNNKGQSALHLAGRAGHTKHIYVQLDAYI